MQRGLVEPPIVQKYPLTVTMEGTSSKSSPQKLDIPSDAAQAIRKEVMVEKLMQSKNTKRPPTAERSTILDQVKAFMPKLRSANEELDKMDKAALQIDSPEEGEPFVEMNLQLYAENSGTSDSDSDSTSSTVSTDSTTDDSDSKDGIPMKQRKLVSELNNDENFS